MSMQSFLRTRRRDPWWVQPLFIFVGLGGFIVYATWAAFQGDHYAAGPYLSPFYSPEIFGESPHSLLGPKPDWFPGWLPWSPAFLILWAPAGFRLTCYYYRGAYYKGFWADPPACTVGEPRKSYLGENAFPLILQNVHRYFLYMALLFLVFLSYDVWSALWFDDGAGPVFGIGLGTIILAVNVLLLGGYTLGCHSLRHLVGGSLDKFSRAPLRAWAHGCASCLNERHMAWAWSSLIMVAFSDVYVRLCAMGIWTDWRIL
ncbi:MAG: succinate dehydrogenase [Acidobacteriota bacterium]